MRNPEKFNNEDRRAEQEYTADLGGAEKAKTARRDAFYDILTDPSINTVADIPLDNLTNLIMIAREHTKGGIVLENDRFQETEHAKRLIKELIREGERLEGRDQAA